MKKILKILENIVCFSLVLVLYTSGSILLWVLGFPFLLVACAKVLNLINHNKIKDSIFSVSCDGRITENALANPTHIFKLIFAKNKEECFINEAENMFLSLNRTDREGNVIKYSTASHGLTYRLLKKLESENYIINLKRRKVKSKKLFFEKLIFGNTKSLNKKNNMYEIEFELSDKKYDGLETKEDLNMNLNNDTRQQIAELKALKNQLLNNNDDIVKDRQR